MNTYPKLFSPIKIGETTVKNRVFMPPISTNLADKGYVTDALVEHYAARAKGGVGLIVTEVTTVEPTYVYLPEIRTSMMKSFPHIFLTSAMTSRVSFKRPLISPP